MKAKLQNLRSLASNGLKDKLQYEEGLRNYLKGQIEKSKEPVFQNVNSSVPTRTKLTRQRGAQKICTFVSR